MIGLKESRQFFNQDKTRQESHRSRRQPEGSFFVNFYCNLRYQPQLTAGGGATPLPLRAQLVPSNTGTHFTYHEWMESWVNFRSIRSRSFLNVSLFSPQRNLQTFSYSTRPGRRSWLQQHCHAITVTDLSMRTMSKSWSSFSSLSSSSSSSSNLKLANTYPRTTTIKSNQFQGSLR